MDNKVTKFAELCAMSSTVGLTMEQHSEKKKLATEMVEEGIMTYYDGCYDFVNEADGDFFQETIEKSKL
jgi:polyhydroxyalkanoate synthesis regulator phasin